MNKTYLAHHGIKGQRWGIRRFQNEDGSLTVAGKRKYNVNEDGTANMKDSYRKSQNTKGAIRVAVGAALIGKSALKIAAGKKNKLDFSSKDGKKILNGSIFQMTLGAIVVASSAKNFVNSRAYRTFNTTGMGATPETFSGKPKTRNQVLAKQNKK